MKLIILGILNVFLRSSFFLLLFFIPFTQGLSAPDWCQVQPEHDDLEIKVPDEVSYFFKVHPDGSSIVFIGDEGNKVLNLESGASRRIPGQVDPVFSPDGKYVTSPIGKHYYNEKTGSEDVVAHVHFFDYQEAIKSDDVESVKSVSFDQTNQGAYQSVGEHPKGGYRLLTDANGVSLSHHNPTDPKVNESGSFQPCSNLPNDFGTNLPMLSADGKYISTHDPENDTTKIFYLRDNGDCDLALDLGFATGKVSFNYDSSQIAFHIDHFEDVYTDGYFSDVQGRVTKDVYVLNLEKNDHQLIPTTMAKATNTHNPGEGAYFPVFDKAGNIYFIRDRDDFFSFHRLDPNQLKYFPFEERLKDLTKARLNFTNQNIIKEDCFQDFLDTLSSVALGAMWSEACLEMEGKDVDYFFLAKGLEQSDCKEMITSMWSEQFLMSLKRQTRGAYQAEIWDRVRMEDLLAACPEANQTAVPEKVKLGEWEKRPDIVPLQQVIEQKCISCHAAPMEYQKEVPHIWYVDEDGNVIKQEKRKVKRTLPAFKGKALYDLEFLARVAMATTDPNEASRMPRGRSFSDSDDASTREHIVAILREDPSKMDEFQNAISRYKNEPVMVLLASQSFYKEQFKKIKKDLEATYGKGLNTPDGKELLEYYELSGQCTLLRENCDKYIQVESLRRMSSLNSASKDLKVITQRVRCELFYNVTREECASYLRAQE